MNEMIERVALALAKASGINDWAKSAHEFEDEARAAIAAMREPTEPMLEAGTDVEGEEWSKGGDTVKLPYQAMIDAALK